MIDKTQLREWIKEYCRFLSREVPDWMKNNPRKFREILKTVKETQEYTRVRDAIRLLHSGRNLLRFHLKDESRLGRIWDEFLKEIVETEPEVLLQNIDERFEKWKKIEGVGKGLITEALSFYYPKHFAPWNNTVEWYFKEFGWGRPNSYSTVLNRLNELRMLFKEVCEDDPDFIMVDHFGWWLKHQLSTQGFEELIGLLRREKEKFSAEWQKEGLPVINEMRNIVDEFIAFKRPDLEPPFPINNKDVEKLLWFIKGGVSSEVDLEKVREYIIELKETDKSNSKTVIEKYWKKIPGVGPTGMITIAAFVYPDTFMPLWGSPKASRGVINFRTSRLLGVDKNAYRLSLNEYLSVIERVRSAAVNVGIVNLFEAAFYLIKYGSEGGNIPQANTTLVEKHNLLYEMSGIDLAEYLHSRGYLYPPYLISQFYTALKTKGLVILSGLSGTGKTKIAQELAKLVDPKGENFLFLPVRPDWRDSKPLIGYYNPLDGKYYETPLLKFILKANAEYQLSREDLQKKRIWFIKCGEEGENTKYAKMALHGNYISIGWYEVPDLRKLSDEELEHLKTRKIDGRGQLKTFFHDISVGDIVVMPLEKLNDKEYKVAIGVITSEYYYKKSPSDTNPQKHRRKVIWLIETILKIGNLGWTVQEVREDTMFLQKDKVISAIVDALNPQPYFILLDEMNLAHVEYYFADFLSVLESGRGEDGFTREGIKLHDVDEVETFDGIPKELHLPPNLYIIGTVNMDETTYSFSPKVLDRAFTIEFHDVGLDGYPPEKTELPPEELEKLRNDILNDLRRGGKFLTVYKKGENNQEKGDIEEALEELKNANNGKYWEILKQLNSALKPYDLHFGYRVVDEIALFFQNAEESWEKKIVEFNDEDEIFDLALLMKVLPKFHGNRKKLEKPLLIALKMAKEGKLNGNEAKKKAEELWNELFGERTSSNRVETIVREMENTEDYTYKHTARKTLRMLRQLYEIGFASFS
ncbi:hypothetical protein [Thermococcus sp.]